MTPRRLPGVKDFRAWIDPKVMTLPWPKVSPDFVSVLGVIAAGIFLWAYRSGVWWALGTLAASLFFDLADGAIVRKHFSNRSDEEKHRGWLHDVVFDRLAEIFTALALHPLALIPVAGNVLLNLRASRTGQYGIFPFRQIILAILFIDLF